MEDEINKKVEETISSLDGMSKAEVKPFFYTRLTSKMQNERPYQTSFGWKWAIASALVIILLNGFSYLSLWPSTNDTDEEIELLVEEYGMTYTDLYSQDLE